MAEAFWRHMIEFLVGFFLIEWLVLGLRLGIIYFVTLLNISTTEGIILSIFSILTIGFIVFMVLFFVRRMVAIGYAASVLFTLIFGSSIWGLIL